MSIYTYLFEAKSIQTYLFETGKLKDTISASERLDQLINDNQYSVLAKVLEQGKFKHDLLCPFESGENLLHFIRCKGGAIYLYAENKSILLKFRQAWTLCVQQLFPSMQFVDGIGQADNICDAVQSGHSELAAARSLPNLQVPLTFANANYFERTGKVAIPRPQVLKYFGQDFDSDTARHRYAYHVMSKQADQKEQSLYSKYTPKDDGIAIKYPINLDSDQQSDSGEGDFPYLGEQRDLALIHVDGNGLGIILRQLTSYLREHKAEPETYCKVFRKFSSTIGQATEMAAQHATAKMRDAVALKSNDHIPMRPLVLGGDDITLLCRADLALDYAQQFCSAFEQATAELLPNCYQQLAGNELSKDFTSALPKKLTASGGIFYQKASQPFLTANQLAEGMCKQAKKLTKRTQDSSGIGQAAISMCATSNAAANEFKDLFKQTQVININQSDKKVATITMGFMEYLCNEASNGSTAPTIEQLRAIIRWFDTNQGASLSLVTLRKALGSLAMGDIEEAIRLIDRATTRFSDDQQHEFKKLVELFDTISAGQNTEFWWMWPKSPGSKDMQTVLADIVMLAKFISVKDDKDAA